MPVSAIVKAERDRRQQVASDTAQRFSQPVSWLNGIASELKALGAEVQMRVNQDNIDPVLFDHPDCASDEVAVLEFQAKPIPPIAVVIYGPSNCPSFGIEATMHVVTKDTIGVAVVKQNEEQRTTRGMTAFTIEETLQRVTRRYKTQEEVEAEIAGLIIRRDDLLLEQQEEGKTPRLEEVDATQKAIEASREARQNVARRIADASKTTEPAVTQ